jgi:hypothetical protein
MNVKVRPQATCHPDKPHYAKGMCRACHSHSKITDFTRKQERERYAKDPESWRIAGFKWRHSFTDDDVVRYNAATICDWCGFPFNGETPHVDHDHRCCSGWAKHCKKCTRGFVHHLCNTHAIAYYEWLEKTFGVTDSKLKTYRDKFSA